MSFTLKAQEMETVNNTVVQLFIATDQRDWEALDQLFAPEVELDYLSMSGSPAAKLSPQEIADSWKAVLPGFEFTHHQLGNILTTVEGGYAHVFCYGTATHFLTDEAGNVWTVVGTYDFDLHKQVGAWKITKMKFNFKYQDGNTGLPVKAMEKAK
ncbi:nuclear transport factor 2 family protein [Persicobacter diffluens]